MAEGIFFSGEPLSLRETWDKGEMPARPRSTKLAGNKEAMAGAGAGAVGGKTAGHMPEDRDGKEELAGADSFPTDHGHAPAAGGGSESAIDGFEAGG